MREGDHDVAGRGAEEGGEEGAEKGREVGGELLSVDSMRRLTDDLVENELS